MDFHTAAQYTTITIASLLAIVKLVLAIIKTRWETVEASCCECNLHQAGEYRKHFRKRHILSGYQSSFMYYYGDKEYTGMQPWKYNPGKYTPGCEYDIKVNPRKPTVVATKVEIAWDYIIAGVCIATIISLLVA